VDDYKNIGIKEKENKREGNKRGNILLLVKEILPSPELRKRSTDCGKNKKFAGAQDSA
jgi:hypothetical protein